MKRAEEVREVIEFCYTCRQYHDIYEYCPGWTSYKNMTEHSQKRYIGWWSDKMSRFGTSWYTYIGYGEVELCLVQRLSYDGHGCGWDDMIRLGEVKGYIEEGKPHYDYQFCGRQRDRDSDLQRFLEGTRSWLFESSNVGQQRVAMV